MPRPTEICRREAVRRMSVLVGGALSSSTVAALLGGCGGTRDRDPAAWAPRVLTAEQLDRLEVLVDTILPPTDTPGASEAGVPAFVDRLLADWAESEERARVLDGLDALDELSREASGLVFLEAGDDARIALLSELDAQAVRAREAQDDPLPFFATLKEWTLTGYYTSEVGATRELQWLAMPGRWDADVPLSEVGRTWA